MARFVLGVEYDGSAYAGWQYQIKQVTVQSCLEVALSKIANEPIRVICAGRTDSGVHALEQVVHFDTEVQRDMSAWLMGTNSQLPEDIRVLWVLPAVADFHARYSAVARFYRYVILNRNTRSALFRHQVTWCPLSLDENKMHKAAQYLLGEHDFSSFRAQACQSKSPWRMMHFIEVSRQQDLVMIDISANAFVHHMVRNIAGVLMDIGLGKQSVQWTQNLLAIKDRKQSAVTASPDGLHLGGVFYPAHYGLKAHPIFDKLPKDARRYS